MFLQNKIPKKIMKDNITYFLSPIKTKKNPDYFAILNKCYKRLFKMSQKMLRSSHWRCSLIKSGLKNFAKLTRKHQCQSLFLNKVTGLKQLSSSRWYVTSLFAALKINIILVLKDQLKNSKETDFCGRVSLYFLTI